MVATVAIYDTDGQWNLQLLKGGGKKLPGYIR